MVNQKLSIQVLWKIIVTLSQAGFKSGKSNNESRHNVTTYEFKQMHQSFLLVLLVLVYILYYCLYLCFVLLLY